MELACGGELLEDLVSRNAFSESTAREAMLQLFSAVQYIHGLRIVHRVSMKAYCHHLCLPGAWETLSSS